MNPAGSQPCTCIYGEDGKNDEKVKDAVFDDITHDVWYSMDQEVVSSNNLDDEEEDVMEPGGMLLQVVAGKVEVYFCGNVNTDGALTCKGHTDWHTESERVHFLEHQLQSCLEPNQTLRQLAAAAIWEGSHF